MSTRGSVMADREWFAEQEAREVIDGAMRATCRLHYIDGVSECERCVDRRTAVLDALTPDLLARLALERGGFERVGYVRCSTGEFTPDIDRYRGPVYRYLPGPGDYRQARGAVEWNSDKRPEDVIREMRDDG